MEKFIVLMYHQVGDIPDKYNIPVKNFFDQLKFVIKQGYRISSIEDINKYDKAYVYTFDDGFKSDLWISEELTKHGFNATFFLVQDFLNKDKSKYLTIDEIKKISDLGHRIGIHGKTHQWWTELSDKKMIDDLSDTKHYFEDLTGRAIESCSAPGGKVNSRVIENIKDSGLFKYLRNSQPGPMTRSEDFFLVNSFAIDKKMALNEFEKIVKMNPFYLKYLISEYHIKNLIKTILYK